MLKEDILNTAKNSMINSIKSHRFKSKEDLDRGGTSLNNDNALMGMVSKRKNVKEGQDPFRIFSRTYPCHNPITGYSNALAIWSAFKYHTSKTIAETYFNWLFTDSPWARTGVIPKDVDLDFMFRVGPVWINLDKMPGNLIHNFLIAMRSISEWPRFINGWYNLVTNHGIDPALAYAFLSLFIGSYQDAYGKQCLFDSDHKDYTTREASLTKMCKYDWPLDLNSNNESYLINFLNANTVGLSKTMFFPTALTTPINILWGEPNPNAALYVTQLSNMYPDLITKKSVKTGLSSYDKGIVTVNSAIEMIKREQSILLSKMETMNEAA
jgi:hypothetical protein